MSGAEKWLVFGILMALGTTCAIIGGFLSLAMIGEINRKLPENEQMSYFGSHIVKELRKRRLYKQFYPNGKYLALYNIVVATMFVFWVLAMGVLFGLFG